MDSPEAKETGLEPRRIDRHARSHQDGGSLRKEFLDVTQIGQATFFHYAQNWDKNRHHPVILYDSSRVILEGGDYDYIHASFVDGYDRNRAYILTQEPIRTLQGTETLSDFWWMAWQQKARIVVVLEPNIMFWPLPGKAETFDVLRIVTIRKTPFGIYDHYSVEMHVDKGGKPVVRLDVFHVTKWVKDDEVPEGFSQFAARLRVEANFHYARTARKQAPFFIAVCSDGARRCGLVVGMDIVARWVMGVGRVGVRKTVESVRRQRWGTFTLLPHYLFLYDYALEVAAYHKDIPPFEITNLNRRLALRGSDP